MIRLPRASARNAPQTQNRKRLLAEITNEQMGLCSRDYRRHLAVCEEYGAEPTNFAIFTIEWLEVRAKTEKTPAGDGPAEDSQARNYDAMYHGKKGFE
jgi:hypothetical protein